MTKLVIADQILPALGDDRIWNLTDNEYKAISSACGVEISSARKKKLSGLLLMHVNNANAETNRLKASDALATLNDVGKATKALLKKIRQLRLVPGMTLEL